jgi:hypothetical protein
MSARSSSALLEDWMPAATMLVRERHELRIAAPPAVVYRSLWEADFGGPLASALLGVRALPSLVTRWMMPRGRAPRRPDPGTKLTLRRFLDSGFAQLEEVPNEELVLGLTGRFWTPTGGLVPTRTETFHAGPAPGQAQAVWNFRLEANGATSTTLITETRVRVAADARARFLLYWSVVRPFSGLLRRLMLRDVRRTAAKFA